MKPSLLEKQPVKNSLRNTISSTFLLIAFSCVNLQIASRLGVRNDVFHLVITLATKNYKGHQFQKHVLRWGLQYIDILH